MKALPHGVQFRNRAQVTEEPAHDVDVDNSRQCRHQIIESIGDAILGGSYFPTGHISILACYYIGMQLLPAVDVLGLDAVRLERGEFDRVLFRRPLHDYIATVVAATQPPLLHLVDLQGARDGAFRSAVLETGLSAATGTPLQVSGGIRSVEAAQQLLATGAQRVIVGTAAFETPTSLAEFVDGLGNSLVVALDVREGRIATRGWQATSDLTVHEALERCRAANVARIHATAIDRDGTMGGPDLALYQEICQSGIPVVAAGGVRHQGDIDALAAVGCEAAVMGTALAIQLGVLSA